MIPTKLINSFIPTIQSKSLILAKPRRSSIPTKLSSSFIPAILGRSSILAKPRRKEKLRDPRS